MPIFLMTSIIITIQLLTALVRVIRMFTLLKNFMAPFHGWGLTASRLEPLRGSSLLFATKFPEIPGTHLIDLEWMKG